MPVYKWQNGRLVDVSQGGGLPDDEELLNSLIERRDRLEQATSSGTGRGGLGGVWDDVKGAADFVTPDFMGALDIISRPSYAIQEGIASAIDPNKRGGVGGSLLDAAVGAGRGLWGTQKTSGIDTLKEHGKEGLGYTALGLAGDIFLDPTTYMGATPLKAVGASAKSAAGIKALGETTEQLTKLGADIGKFDPNKIVQSALKLNNERLAAGQSVIRGPGLSKEAIARLTRDAEEKTLQQLNDDFLKPYGLAKRSKTPRMKAQEELSVIEKSMARFNLPEYTAAQRKEKLDELARANAFSIARATQKAAEAGIEVKRAGLNLRFGKNSTEIRADNPLVSKVVDNPKIRNTASSITNSDIVQNLNKKFRTEGTYGKLLNESRKLHNSFGVASFDELRAAPIASAAGKTINDFVKGLNTKEAKEFTRAYELKDIQQLPEIFESGMTREDAWEIFRYQNDNFFDAEFDSGLLPYKRDADGNVIADKNGQPIPGVEKVEGYAHHIPIKGQKEYDRLKNKKKYVRAVGKDIFEPGSERVFKTIEDAKKANVTMEDDARLILLNRTAKHTGGTARASFVKNAADNFGVRLSDPKTLKLVKEDGYDLVNLKKVLKDSDGKAPLEYLDDSVYVERHVAEGLKGIQTVTNNPGPFLKLMDNFMQRWKSAVTVYNPGHHVRNAISDVMLGYLDGVNSLAPYAKAMDAIYLKKLDGQYKIGNGNLPKSKVMALFRETGASPNFIQTEIPNATAGKVGRGVRQVAQQREETVRFAHFLDALNKEAAGIKHGGVAGKEIIDASVRASQRVKKWHLDYSDLTDFEKVTMKRIIPFYTWMRKSAPLMVEAMVLRPGKVANIDKTFQAMFTELGVDPGEALPQDQIPEWIRESIYGQIGGGSGGGNPTFLQPDIPMSEPFQYFDNGLSGALQTGLSSLNPIPKGIIELGMGKSTFTGAPINQDVGRYATGTLPQARLLEGLASGQAGSGSKLINWATGAGIREVQPSSQRGEIRRQIDILEGKLAEMGIDAPTKAQSTAPKRVFAWENGRLVKKGRDD